MKNVSDFREDLKGFYIDLEDQFSSLAVNRQTGDLLLDEGEGNDRYNGALILQQSFPQFVTRPHRGKLDIWLEYGKDHGVHFIGTAVATRTAVNWILRANQTMKGSVLLPPIRQGRVGHFGMGKLRLKHKKISTVVLVRRSKLLSQMVTKDR